MSRIHQENTSTIFDYKTVNNSNNWYVVNDAVMGGLSKSTIETNEEGKVLFKGDVTTENNGGFASVRYVCNSKDVSPFTHVILQIKGDGKDFQFRIKEVQNQRHSFIATFSTSGNWETIKIPLSSFYPSFRGKTLDIPNFSGKTMEGIAFLIGNKKKESFQLEIERILLE